MTYLAGKLVLEIREGAPNNGESDSNIGRVKQMRINRLVYPYISPQSYRRWLRDTLTDGTPASPVVRSGSGAKQQAYTAGEPHHYLDDDLFGYMRAIKNAETQRDSVLSIGTLRAISPQRPVEDFGTMSRGFGANENPVLHQHEFYTADVSADWLIDVGHIGVFTLGGAGHRTNLTPQQAKEAKEGGAGALSFRGIEAVALPVEVRRDRLAALLEAMAATRGGAKQALHYGDRAPALLIAAPMRGGVNPFGRVIGSDDGRTVFRPEVLLAELSAWEDELAGPVQVGWAPGYLDDERGRAQSALATQIAEGSVVIDHPRTMLRTLAEKIRTGAHDEWFATPELVR